MDIWILRYKTIGDNFIINLYMLVGCSYESYFKLAEVYTYLLSVAKMTINKKTLEIIRLRNHFLNLLIEYE